MKYILLAHHAKDTFDAPKDPADVAEGRAYGAALHAARNPAAAKTAI
ncbi:MAG: hypothetical protein WAN79_07655 [Opitutaceae bacterium]